MDFKNYVKMMLEAEKAKDQDEERAEDQDEDEEDSDDEEDEDDEEAQASVKTSKTGCTGGEASADTEDDDDSDDEDDEDDSDDDDEEDDDKCPDCGKKPCECKKGNSLRESAIRYSRDNYGISLLTEEEMVLCEDIKNNSASKYLAKLSKRAEKEAAKYSKKGMKQEAALSKKSASALKEASNKLFKCETRYKGGDASAKREYKQICKQYSKELKTLGKGARGLKNLVFTLVSGVILLGAVGTTVIANDNPDGGAIAKISKAIEAFKAGRAKDGFSALGDIGENNKSFINSVISGEKFKATDWEGTKADIDAHLKGWSDAEQRRRYTEEGLGGFIKKGVKKGKDFMSGFTDTYKGAGEEVRLIGKGAKESLTGK